MPHHVGQKEVNVNVKACTHCKASFAQLFYYCYDGRREIHTGQRGATAVMTIKACC